MLDGVDLIELISGQLLRQRVYTLPEHRRRARQLADLLRRRQRLQRHLVPDAVALLRTPESAHMTRASNLSFSTSFAAAVFRDRPRKSATAWLFCGR